MNPSFFESCLKVLCRKDYSDASLKEAHRLWTCHLNESFEHHDDQLWHIPFDAPETVHSWRMECLKEYGRLSPEYNTLVQTIRLELSHVQLREFFDRFQPAFNPS
jgi:hypothetical protein